MARDNGFNLLLGRPVLDFSVFQGEIAAFWHNNGLRIKHAFSQVHHSFCHPFFPVELNQMLSNEQWGHCGQRNRVSHQNGKTFSAAAAAEQH
jgi:hypothetical protein